MQNRREARLDMVSFRNRLRFRSEVARAQGRKRRSRKPPRILLPANAERDYVLRLKTIISKITQLTKTYIVPDLPRIVDAVKQFRPDSESVRLDGYQDEIEKLIQTMRAVLGAEFPESRIIELATETARQVEAGNKLAVNRMFKALLGVDSFIIEPWLAEEMRAFVTENVKLIKTLSETAFSDIERVVMNGARSGLTSKAIAKQLLSKVEGARKNPFDSAKRRAALIARDQTNKFNGQLNMLRQREAGGQQYIWRTSLDARVRDSHRRLEGSIQTWAKPPIIDGVPANPGEPINCRCYAEFVPPGSEPTP